MAWLVLLSACNNGLDVPRETACRFESLLHSATSAVARGITENEAGDLSLAAAAGEEATEAGTELHAALSAATDLDAETIMDLDGVAMNAQQIGIFLSTRTQIETEGPELEQALQAMKAVALAWTQRLRNAGIRCP